ncbi:MAG: hypothetical protein JSS66_06435 [Armatimonadetes bacterium]|nr:hypothetical protein [Armatimonadota bacterium]
MLCSVFETQTAATIAAVKKTLDSFAPEHIEPYAALLVGRALEHRSTAYLYATPAGLVVDCSVMPGSVLICCAGWLYREDVKALLLNVPDGLEKHPVTVALGEMFLEECHAFGVTCMHERRALEAPALPYSAEEHYAARDTDE